MIPETPPVLEEDADHAEAGQEDKEVFENEFIGAHSEANWLQDFRFQCFFGTNKNTFLENPEKMIRNSFCLMNDLRSSPPKWRKYY